MYTGGLCKHQLHGCSLQTALAPSWCELRMNYSTLVPGWQAACLCSALGHGGGGPWLSAELAPGPADEDAAALSVCCS